MSELSNIGGRAEDAARYTRAILELLGERDPFEVLESSAAQLAGILGEPGGAPTAALRVPEAPGKWSILEVAQHLADSELAWSWRLRTVLADDRPTLTGYDQNRWADRFAYRDADPAEVVAQFELLRRLNLRILHGLSEEDRQRVGLHTERGEESVEHMIHLYAGHDLVHLRQMARIAEARG